MEYKPLEKKQSVIQNKLSDEKEKERVLMQYAGIFPSKFIKEFAETVIPLNKKRKNLSK